jgi:hypothetical protein
MSNSTSQSSSYSVLTFVTDELRRTEIPVGIALWSSRSHEGVQIRLASDKEKIAGFRQEWMPYLDLVSSQLQGWLAEGRLPYDTAKLEPKNDAWWRHLRNLLVHRVRISEPKAIDCKNAREEADLLFEAVVQPQRPEEEKKHRVDRALTTSLGSLSKKFSRGMVTGFYGRPVPVKRYLQDGEKLLVLEGVNLASSDAEKETDALVSRLLRISAVDGSSPSHGGLERQMVAIVGYLTSPGGLNGEAALVKWIEEKAGAQTFDLVREKERFAGSVESEMFELGLTH